MPRRKIDPEVRAKAIEMVKCGEKSQKDIAAELCVSLASVRNWSHPEKSQKPRKNGGNGRDKAYATTNGNGEVKANGDRHDSAAPTGESFESMARTIVHLVRAGEALTSHKKPVTARSLLAEVHLPNTLSNYAVAEWVRKIADGAGADWF